MKTRKKPIWYLSMMVSATLFLCAFSTFRGEQGTGAANVVSYETPVDISRGGTIWTRAFSTAGSISYNSIPILTEHAIYVVNTNILYELEYNTGKILRQMTLCTKMNSVCNMLLQDHSLYIPLSNGTMECVDITTMTSCWQSEAFGGQSLSTVFYHEGYLYAGSTTVTSQGTTGVFYCLDARDGCTKWTYEDSEHAGGYYWSGGIVRGDALYFTGDNGILVSHSLLEDEVYDTRVLTETAMIRAGITYCEEKDTLYTVSNDGVLYEIRTNGTQIGQITSSSLVPEAGQMNCTSTPTIYNNRIYVGCLADQYGYVTVVDADSLQTVYKVQGPKYAEVKSSPLVSTRGETSGKVYVYFSANAIPGGLYYFIDQPDATTSTWQTLYIPAKAKQFCLSSITAGSDGTLYYSNDSGTLFAVQEVEQSSDQIPATPSVTTTSNPGLSPEPSSIPQVTASPKPDTKQYKPAKPTKVKIKNKKRKVTVRWTKKTKKSQTLLYVKYGSGKWKKKVLKKKTSTTLRKKGKKTIRIRLRCRNKQGKKWYYSAYTKTFLLKP